jgi:Fe-S-cluster containining protein
VLKPAGEVSVATTEPSKAHVVAAPPLSAQSLSTASPFVPSQSVPVSPCQACGACCACEPDWPRFSTETDAELDLIPIALVDPSLSRMAWTGSRCAALAGEVGSATACTIYAIRPHVCRACEPGDDACTFARIRHGMAPLAPPPFDDAPVAAGWPQDPAT